MYPKLKPLQDIDGTTKRLLLQNVDATKMQEFIDSQEKPELFKFEAKHSIEINYENYSMNDALKVLLTQSNLSEKDVPSGFEIIGDIAHMNLNDKQFPFRYQVGQVVLDKNPKLRSVVCKIGQIESQFRFYELECIAGQKD
jgi:tRNA (guanine37-N1)-methyltransferase